MPIDCNASYIDASMVCDEGRVLVCLRDTDGTAYFDRFDINGGPATGVGPSTTGFVTSNNNPPYTQDYQVTNEPANFQCFYIPYNVGTQTGDILVIQTTDDNNVPVGDACTLSFTVNSQSACEATCADSFVCPASPIQVNAVTGQDFCLNRQDLGVPDYIGNSCTVSGLDATGATFQIGPLNECIIKVLAGNLPAVGGTFTVEFDVNCCGIAQAVNCTALVTVVDLNCIDCDAVVLSNVSSTDLSAGQTLTFGTQYSGNLSTNLSPIIKNAAGAQIGSAAYVSTAAGVNTWSWLVPANCLSGDYTVCLQSAVDDPACPVCDLFTVTLNCDCPDPVIDQCSGGSVALVAGVPTALSVSGCDCADAITWSSPNPQLSFNPTTGASTQVTSTTTGNYTIEVECCVGAVALKEAN